jgi:restriction system protein
MLLLAATTFTPDQILRPALEALWQHLPFFTGIGLLVVLVNLLKCKRFKGVIGEAVVNWGGLSRLNKDRYRVLKNLLIPSITGDGMTEIDHVVVSEHGIFVIETKNFTGWIFGREHDRKWTCSTFGNKRQFLNPLKQNSLHVNSLAAFLGLPRSMFHSVVFFVGDATLKTPMPSNVLTRGLIDYIEGKRAVLVSSEQVASAWGKLIDHDSSMDKRKARKDHIARLSEGRV